MPKTVFQIAALPGTIASKLTDVGRAPARQRKHIAGLPGREHTIRDERDYAAHMDYIHFNPVKHGLVKEARAWEYSSFHRCVAAGLYPLEWGGTDGDAIYGGERE
jgi:putative transposase